jgi:hypothetical protein
MSHFTTIKTEIRDLAALADACADLDLKLVPSTICRGYGGAVRKADHVIRLKGPYDIALDPMEGGRYGFSADWWAGHVEKEVGPGFGRLLQSYGVHKTLREARMRGLRTSRQMTEDGTILLTLEGGSL